MYCLQNDDEDGTSTKASANPAIVSIPNPLYSGYRAFAEPFGVFFTHISLISINYFTFNVKHLICIKHEVDYN